MYMMNRLEQEREKRSTHMLEKLNDLGVIASMSRQASRSLT